MRGLLRNAALACAALGASAAQAWDLPLAPGPKELFLMVGVGTPSANNATINLVSVTVPAANVGNGTPQPMTSDSTQAASANDGSIVCNPPAQVYIGASFRRPGAGAGGAPATLQVTTPPNLTSGTDTIPFSQISWTSTANGNPTADIPAGTFNGGTLFLRTIPRNRFIENCLTYSYANAAVVPAGTFNGRAVFTLAVP